MRKKEITLYEIKREDGNWYRLSASLDGGCLYLEGQDFTALAESMFGDEEHEYYYSFDAENTRKLAALFRSDDLLAGLSAFFGGELRNIEFLRLCAENGIEYRGGPV